MLNKSDKTIVISDEYIYTPRIESVEQMDTSPFSGIYRDAMKSLAYICRQGVDEKYGNEPVKECNPIIAFVGERGSGKTSALESFRRALQAGYCHDDKTVWPDGTILTNSKFDVLPIIDPTALCEYESLLGVIAAHMYRQIEQFQCEYRGKRKGDDVDSAIRNAAQQLKDLYDALRALNQERSEQFVEFGGYDRLGQLSISYNLREQFMKAVDTYLMLTGKINDSSNLVGKRRFLVIPIDDLDMNAKDGYKLCEELRKYMMVPGIVVLMSAKIDQLQSVIAEELTKQLPNEKNASGSMAERYLAKLIPINRRHALPILTIHNMVEYYIAPEESELAAPLVDTLFELLYDRLGLILVKNGFNSHVFLPCTLRGIVHLYYLLVKMPAVLNHRNPTPLKYDDERIQNIDQLPGKLSQNIDAFWAHFLSNGMGEVADPRIPLKLLEQMRTEHWSGVNRLVVKAIKRIMENDSEKMLSEGSDHWDSIADICSVETIKENVSLGDALYMLDRLETWAATPQWDRFVASIRVAYSLLLIRMFFIERQPDDMRRFIVQLNNPDMQELVPPNASSQERRDWQVQVDPSSFVWSDENSPSLTDYYAGMQKKMEDDDRSIINDDNPIKWLNLSVVWCGYQKNLNRRTYNNWRSVWDKPYLDSIELLANPQTKNIAINYMACMTNLLSPAAFWKQDAVKAGANYVMVFPLYSADLIQYVVSLSKKASSRKDKLKNKEFEYFEYFIEGIKDSIDNLNGEKGKAAKCPYTIAMERLESPVMVGYNRVDEILRLQPKQDEPPKRDERLVSKNIARLSKILGELTALNKNGARRAKKAGSMVKYCDDIINMFDNIKVLGPSQRQIMSIKRWNEDLPAGSSSKPGTQEELINMLKRIVDSNTPVSTHG